jgi:hypothetical protein
MLTASQRETREFNYQRHGLLCNLARLTTAQATAIKRASKHYWGDEPDTSVTGVNLFVGGLLLTVKAPSPDHNFIVVEEPSLEAKELFAQDNATSVR